MKILPGKRYLLLATTIVFLPSAASYAQGSQTVVMARIGNVIQKSLPGAADYFVKKIAIGQNNRAEIEAKWNFSPDASTLKFFYGENSYGQLVGTVFFDWVDTRYGPIEVGTAFEPWGAVSNVVVAKATVKTEPWVEAVLRRGLVKNLIGLDGTSTLGALKNLNRNSMGPRNYFMTQAITTAVIRGIIYYDSLFQPHLRG